MQQMDGQWTMDMLDMEERGGEEMFLCDQQKSWKSPDSHD